VPKIITKIFKQEGELAYKNIKKQKVKYRMIIVLIALNITIFAGISGFTENLYRGLEIFDDGCDIVINVSNELKDELLEKLNKKNLMKKYMAISDNAKSEISIPRNKLTKDMERLIKTERYKKLVQEDGSVKITTIAYKLKEESYQEILNKEGISELKENEVILVNSMKDASSKFGNDIKITSYKKGDIIDALISTHAEERRKKKV
jgi:putative ABC transport system permease protein